MKWSKLLIIGTVIGMAIPTIGLGFLMLPAELGIVWGIFNAWMWIGAPITILWAIKKEEEKEHEKISINSSK